MSLTIDLTPETEARLAQTARQRGMSPSEFARLLLETAPMPKNTPFPETAGTSSEDALAMLRDLAQMKEGMRESDSTETDRLLHEARTGTMSE